MPTIDSSAKLVTQPMLRCDACGNASRFVEIMSHEAHLIDGQFNYLHLLDAEVDHYECCVCGEPVEPCILEQ